MKNNIVLELTEKQNDALREYYDRNFMFCKRPGVILGHPDMNCQKIQFAAFSFWEYCLLYPAFFLIKLIRRDFIKRENVDEKGYYSLKNAKVEG